MYRFLDGDWRVREVGGQLILQAFRHRHGVPAGGGRVKETTDVWESQMIVSSEDEARGVVSHIGGRFIS